MIRVIVLSSAMVVTAFAAAWDWRKGQIPNWMTLGPLGLALVFHTALGGWQGAVRGAFTGLGYSLLGAIACAAVPLLLYRLGAMGGGDVKLLLAIGAICRIMVGLEAEFYGFLVAALYAPVRLIYEGKFLRTLGNTLTLLLNPILPKGRRRSISPEMMSSLRFGPPMFVGTCVAVWMHWRGP
jgi:prepilin peptidase CpaA